MTFLQAKANWALIVGHARLTRLDVERLARFDESSTRGHYEADK